MTGYAESQEIRTARLRVQAERVVDKDGPDSWYFRTSILESTRCDTDREIALDILNKLIEEAETVKEWILSPRRSK